MSDKKQQSRYTGDFEKIQGRVYLRAHSAISWFRDDFPANEAGIRTELISMQPIMYKAEVWIDGVLAATAHASEKSNNKDHGKIETNAVRRALAYCGYGTEAAVGDDDFDDETGESLPHNGNQSRQQPTRPTPQPQPPADNPVVQTAQANGAQVSKVEKPWKDAYKDFISDWVARDVPQESLLTILNIKRWGEWTGTRAEADALVTAWQAKQPIPA
jgi:hypothetical protein